MALVLVVEDCADVSRLVQDELRALAYDVTAASDGVTALECLQSTKPDVLILDIMLPRMNGLELLRRARESGFDGPILVLSARDAEADRVAGLELGADDYLVKPFSLRELSARVAALLRRQARGSAVAAGSPRLGDHARRTWLDCELDTQSAWVRVAGRPCTLSQREMALLALLMQSPGRVLTREWLLEQVWGRDYNGEDRAVDACVLRLRDRLGRDSAIARALESVRGLGYRLKDSP